MITNTQRLRVLVVLGVGIALAGCVTLPAELKAELRQGPASEDNYRHAMDGEAATTERDGD